MGQINNTFLRRDGRQYFELLDLNLNKHRVTNLGEPTAADDAVTRQYVSHYISYSGMAAMLVTGIIDMSRHRLMNLGEPLGGARRCSFEIS
jgi:hypothetical protein